MYKQLHVPILQPTESDFLKVNLDENALKLQNHSLATRVDYLKKTLKDQRLILQELVEREIRHQKFFNMLETAWRGFLQRNVRIQSLIKQKRPPEAKFLNAFQYLDDVFNGQYIFANNVESHFKKTSLAFKFEQFLRLVENIYFEVSQALKDYSAQLIEKTSLLIEGDDAEPTEYIRRLVSANKELSIQFNEIEANYKSTQKLRERKINDIDGQLAYQTIFQLQNLLGEQRRLNEHLSRKVRVLSNQAISDKYINDDEHFECICGGAPQGLSRSGPGYHEFAKQYADVKPDESKKPLPGSQKEQPVSLRKISQLLQRAVKGKNTRIVQSEDETYQFALTGNEMKDLEQILQNYFAFQAKVDFCTQQNKKYEQAVTSLTAKCKELEIQNQYREDQFVESEIYKFLKDHNVSLIDQNSQLTFQIHALQQQNQELINTRQGDCIALQKYFENEIAALASENGMLKARLSERQTITPNHYANEDFNLLYQGLKDRYAQEERVLEALRQEMNTLIQQFKELRQKADELQKQKEELQLKLTESENRVLELQSKIPDAFSIEQLSFRHSKHKEILVELTNVLAKNFPTYKEKFNEIVSYVKSRDSRVEQLEKDNQKQKKLIADTNKQLESMIEEIEQNHKVFDEGKKKQKMVEDQLKIKEQHEARLSLEKIADKANYDADRAQLQQKIRTQHDLINRLQNQVQDQQQLLQKYSQERIMKAEFDDENLKKFEQLKRHLSIVEQELSQVKIERDSYANKINKGDLINQDLIQQNDRLQQQLFEMEFLCQDKEKLLNDPTYLEQVRGYLILKSNGQLTASNVLAKLKQFASCLECKTQFRETIIQRCLHMLCKDCGNRAGTKGKCSICQLDIDMTDVWEVKELRENE